MAWSQSLSANESSVDIQNNASYITATYSIKTTGDAYNMTGNAWYKIDCAGYSTGETHFTINKNSSKKFTHTFGPIAHNADGSLPAVKVYGSARCTDTKNLSTNVDVPMTTIPRASDFSVSGTTLGSNTHITISRASNSFTHTVIYQLGNAYQEYYNKTDSCDFTRPYSDANQMDQYSVYKVATITVITYNNGTEVGRKSKDVSMGLPDNNDTKPVINNPTVIEDSMTSIASKFGAYIQLNSRPKFTFDCSARYGANIRDYTIEIDGNTYTSSSNVITIGAINNSGSINYTCKIRDTRGRIITESGIISVVAYSLPTLTIDVERDQQNNCVVKLVGNITSLSNENDKILKIKYKTHSSQSYQNVDVQLSGYTINETVSIPISDSSSYDFYGSVQDFFTTYNTNVVQLSTAFDLLHFRANGQGLGIGKKAERDALDIGLDIYYKNIDIDTYIQNIVENTFEDLDEEEF